MPHKPLSHEVASCHVAPPFWVCHGDQFLVQPLASIMFASLKVRHVISCPSKVRPTVFGHFHLNSNHIYNLPFLCHSLASLSWAPTTLTQGQNAVNLIIASSFPFLGIIWPTKSASCVSHYVWGVSLRWLSQLMYVVLISKTHIVLSSFIINDGWDLYCVILIYKSMLIYHTFQENWCVL